MMNTTNDHPEPLLQAIRQGDASAVNPLLEHFRPYLRLLARIHVGKHLQAKVDESDLVQEATLLAARDISTFRGNSEQELAAWFRQILANAAANTRRHFQQQKRDVRLEQQFQSELDKSSEAMPELVSQSLSPSEHSQKREQAVVLASALDKLPDDYREVIMLRDFEGKTLAEIAIQLGRSTGSVQKLWARAIAQLRSALRAYE